MSSCCLLVVPLSLLAVTVLAVQPNQQPACSSISSVCSIIIATSGENGQPDAYRAIPQCSCAEGFSCPSSPDNQTLQVKSRQWYGMCQNSDVLPKCSTGDPYLTVTLTTTVRTIHRKDIRFHCTCESSGSITQNPSMTLHQETDGDDTRSIVVFCGGSEDILEEPESKRGLSSFYKRSSPSSRLQKRSTFGNVRSFYKRGDQDQSSDLLDKRSGLSSFYKRNGISSFYKRDDIDSELKKLYLAAFGLESDLTSLQKDLEDDEQDEDLDLQLDDDQDSIKFEKKGLSSFYKRTPGSLSSFYKRSFGNDGLSSFYKKSRGLSQFYKRGLSNLSNFYKRAGVSAFYKRSPGSLSSFYKRSPGGLSRFYKRGGGFSRFYRSSPSGLSSFYKRYPNSMSSFYKRGLDGINSFYKRGSNGYSSFYKRDDDIDDDDDDSFQKRKMSSFYKRGLDGTSSFYKRGLDSTNSFYKRGLDSTSSFYKRGLDSTNSFYKRGLDSTSSFYKRGSGMSSFYKRGGLNDLSSFYKRAPSGLSRFYKRGGLSSFYKRNGNELLADDNDLIDNLATNKNVNSVL